jgi:hypothetical protein
LGLSVIRQARILSSFLMVLLVVACGSDDVDKPRSQQVADVGEAPDELVGTYSLNLNRNDLPEDPPPELSGGVGGWTLKIANSGGPWGRSFAVVNDRLGTLEEPAFSVEEDRISLEEQECAVMDPGTKVESEYQWTLSGSSLTFEVVSNGCPDDVMLTLLSAKPWTKDGF